MELRDVEEWFKRDWRRMQRRRPPWEPLNLLVSLASWPDFYLVRAQPEDGPQLTRGTGKGLLEAMRSAIARAPNDDQQGHTHCPHCGEVVHADP
jgi:hypothetical protein